MPAGVVRSKFIPPLAKSLGWSLGRLRALLNRNGYDSPYLDEPRALRILVDAGHDIRPYLDKAGHPPDFMAKLNRPSATSTPRPTEPRNELILAQPPSPPIEESHQTLPTNYDPLPPLIVRLAKLLGGVAPEYQEQARAILKQAGMDGRTKDEDRVLKVFVSKGISIEGFQRRGDAVHGEIIAGHDIDRMPVAEVREYAKLLQRRSAEQDQEIAKLHTRHRRLQGLMESAKHRLIQEFKEGARDDISVTENFLFFIRDEAKQKP